jgi:MFS family permease
MSAIHHFFAEYQRTWRSTGPAGRGFLLGGLIYMMRGIGFSVAFPLYAKQRGYDPGDIGLLLAASQLALLLLGIPITILGGRGLARRLLAIGPAFSALGILVILLSPDGSLPIAALGTLLAGAGSASFWVLGDPLLAATTPPAERAHIYSLKFFIVTLGISIGGGLGGWIPGLVTTLGSSKLTALAVTLVVFGLLDLLQVYMFGRIPEYEPVLPRIKRSGPRGRFFPKGSRLPWVVMGAMAVPEIGMSFGHNSIRPFLSLYFPDARGLTESTTGTVLATLGLLAGVGSLAAPRIAQRLGNLPAVAVMRAAGALAILLWFTSIGLPPLLGLMVVYYLIVDGSEGIYITEIMHLLPVDRRTWFSGIYAMAWSLAATLALVLSGFIQDHNDGRFGYAFTVGAAGYLFSVAWMLTVVPRLPAILSSDAVANGLEPAVQA